MANIKDTFVGVVYARNKAGDLVKLRAGDSVPSGVEVPTDLVAAAAPKEAPSGKSNTGTSASSGGK